MSAPTSRVLFVFGTRPEAIKMAPLILAMKRNRKRFEPIVCVTGQHREMLDQVLASFSIKPDYDLGVMEANQTLAGLTSRVLERTDEVLRSHKPDLVLVQGDTTTAFASALAAFYRGIAVGHVEAGLRTGDLRDPFPEEANRLLIDRLAHYCFAPTERNRETLLSEGIPSDRIFVTGNTGVDALLMMSEKVKGVSPARWTEEWGSAAAVVSDETIPVVLITLHRRESFGAKLNGIFESVRAVALERPQIHFIYPVHLNPNVKEPAHQILRGLSNVHLVEPLAYEPFIYLMNRARLILTDSGGIQEEAPSIGKRVIVVRDRTERQEALLHGTVKLGGTNPSVLVSLISEFLDLSQTPCPVFPNPYGDGHAAEAILKVID